MDLPITGYEHGTRNLLFSRLHACDRLSRFVFSIMDDNSSKGLFLLWSLSIMIFLVDLATPHGFAVPILYVLPLGLTLGMTALPSPLLLAAMFSTLTVFVAIYDAPGASFSMVLFNRAAAIIILWIGALAIRENKDAAAELEDSRQNLVSLTDHLETAREEERARIALELHDQIGQSLTVMNLDLSRVDHSLRGPCSNADHVAAHARTLTIREELNHGLERVQRLAFELRPPRLEEFGLIGAIEWQLEQFKMQTGIVYTVSLPETVALESAGTTVLFRVFQESLTNIARHAHANHVTISLQEETDRLIFEIRDNGVGIDPEVVRSSRSIGLMGMRERVRSVAGQISISGTKGQGTSIVLILPKH